MRSFKISQHKKYELLRHLAGWRTPSVVPLLRASVAVTATDVAGRMALEVMAPNPTLRNRKISLY